MTGPGISWLQTLRFWIAGVCLLGVGTAGYFASGLEFSDDTRQFFSEDYPPLKALESLENTYNRVDAVLITLAPAEGDVFTRENLAAIRELTREAWKTPHSTRVESLANYPHSRAEGDDLVVADLVPDSIDLTPEMVASIRHIALSEPYLVNYLVSQSGHVAAVAVTVIKSAAKEEQNQEVMDYVRGLTAAFQEKYPAFTCYLTGGVASDIAFAEASRRDSQTLIPLMFLVMILLMVYYLKSFWATVGTMAVIAASTITAMGLAALAGMVLTTASAVAPVIIMTLAVADCVHILNTFFQFWTGNRTKREALRESLRVNFQPVLLTSLTTAIGFLSMNFSESPPFRDLGNIVAMGVIAALVFSLALLPALLFILPVAPHPVREGAVRGKLMGIFPGWAAFARWVVKQRRLLLGVCGAGVLVLAYGIRSVELNDAYDQYFDHRFEIRRATDFVEANLTGMDDIQFSIPSSQEGGIADPAYLEILDGFAEWFRRQEGVAYVYTFADTMKRLNKNMHGDDSEMYRIPGSRALASQYLLLYEFSLPFGADLNHMINLDRSASRATVVLKDASSRRIQELCRRGEDWLKTNAPPEMFAHGTGLSVMFAHIAAANIHGMLRGTFLALMLISAVLVFALRHLRLGLVSLVPNLVPAIMTFGLWGYLVGEIGLAVSVVAALSLGIVVDDTIHFTSKYLRARRETGCDPPRAVEHAFLNVGQAIFHTSVILSAGFLVLALSGFKVNAHMGLLTAMAITFALLTDCLLLPPLLMLVDKEGGGGRNRIQNKRGGGEDFTTEHTESANRHP